MKINELEKIIKKLGYNVYFLSSNEISVASDIISLVSDEYISAFVIKTGDAFVLSDRHETILSWSKGDEIKNNKPINLIKEFAKENGAEFDNYCLTKNFDVNKDIDNQLNEFFKVLIYADKIFAEFKNK